MKPEVSVVMAVHDDAPYLEETIDSILSQEGPALELVVVDDGSTDGSREIVRRYAGLDRRVRIVEQENRGLTRALIRGCAIVTTEYVARQDAADVSRPGRLAAQAAALEADEGLAFVSCWTDMCGPEWEFLYTRRKVDGPTHHGSVMFRKSAYDRVGGYREEFYLAQDWDLWYRLEEVGRLRVLEEVLYAARVLPASRSSTYRETQLRLGGLARRALEFRQEGHSEIEVIREAGELRPGATAGEASRAAAYYFIGEALRRNRDRRSIGYFRKSLALKALDGRTWVRLAQASLYQGLCRASRWWSR
jgi:glycosyltransferase involved in cell wall biosynthesis